MGKLLILICCLGFVATALAKPGRVVGGSNAGDKQFPHQISIQVGSDRRHNCGGSIISENWVLTAAHCVDVNNPRQYTIAAGSNKYKNVEIRKVKKIISHEWYSNFQYDIALIEVSEPFVFTETLNKIAVYKEKIPDGSQITISGWGRVSTNGQIPDHLQYNDRLSTATEDQCRSATGNIYFDGIICLNHEDNNGVCFGDSGGPALYNGLLVGVANFVMGGCGTTNPDGYCKVSEFVDWINFNAGSNIV